MTLYIIKELTERLKEDISTLSNQEKINFFEQIIDLIDEEIDEETVSFEEFKQLIEIKRHAMGKIYNLKREEE